MENYPYGEIVEMPEFTYYKIDDAFAYSETPHFCSCCKKATNILYTGPIYCENPPEALCPTCIAYGACAYEYNAIFILPNQVEQIIVGEYEDLCKHTPGINDVEDFCWPIHHERYCELVAICNKQSDIPPHIREELCVGFKEKPLNVPSLVYFVDGGKRCNIRLSRPGKRWRLYLFRCRHSNCQKLFAYAMEIPTIKTNEME